MRCPKCQTENREEVILADADQKDKARENQEKVLGMMNEMGMMYWPDRAREVLARL